MAKSPNSRTSLKILGDRECPSCVAKGRDSKGNHLILFENAEGQHFGKCNRCGHYEPPTGNLEPNPRREKSPEELAEELRECAELPFRALSSRSITLGVAERFGVKVALSEVDGSSVVEHYYPRTREGDTCAYNVRSLDPKYFFYRGSPKGGVEPFGWVQCNKADVGRKRLFIAEDELSAMSIYQLLEARTSEKYRHIKPAVMSWSSGVDSAPRDLQFMQEQGFLKQFGEVIYVHDNDEAGFKSVDKVRAIIPDCKFVTTDLKDANDMLMAGRGNDLFQLLIFQSKTKSPACAIKPKDALELALAPPQWGLSFPWESLTNLTYGQRPELRSWGAGVGLGKTLTAHELVAHNITEHKLKVGVALLEENNGDTLKNICGKIANVPFHRPDIPFDRDRFMGAYDVIKDNLFLWSNKGQNDFDAILEAFRFWVVVEGVNHLVLDNITCLVGHLEPTQQNTEIARIAMKLAGLVDELGVMVDIYSHLNPPGGSKSHENGAEVKENQFTGSRALMRWSQFMLGFERNKQAEGDEKHLSRIRVLKNRPYGLTGIVHTKYDMATGRLMESDPHEIAGGDDDEPFV